VGEREKAILTDKEVRWGVVQEDGERYESGKIRFLLLTTKARLEVGKNTAFDGLAGMGTITHSTKLV